MKTTFQTFSGKIFKRNNYLSVVEYNTTARNRFLGSCNNMRDFMTSNSVFYLRKEIHDDLKDYKDDFKKVIHERENGRIIFLHQSPQISYRKCLVDHLKKVCIDRTLSQSCLHLSIYLLDIFMDNHHIIEERLLLVANVCLLLAAKLEENSLSIPKISELNSLVDERYDTRDYRSLEILILQFFNFYIKFPTPAHYVFYYMQEFISYDDLNDPRNFRTLFYDIYEMITLYLDKIIYDVHYMQYYRPSKLAAAVIAASRKEIGLACWTKQLEDLTEYNEEQLQNPMQFLLKTTVLNCSSCNIHQTTNIIREENWRT